MNDSKKTSQDFSVVYYIGDRKTGAVHIVTRNNGQTTIEHLPVAPGTGLDKPLKPVMAGLTQDRHMVLLDPRSKEVQLRADFPADTFPAHLYADPYSNRDWFMNDGDKETGNDALNCGDKGSSVTVIANTANRNATFLKTICIGRGHHQAAFTAPSATAPNVPQRAYISNLNDGTVSVIGNDCNDAASYLNLLTTINLCEAGHEEGVADKIPNTAYPHGLAYSPVAGKLYNLNSGYGTVTIIDPVTNAIEERLNFKGYSNLFAAPGGRYLIGRGADRKSDPSHVIASIAVLDTVTNTLVDKLDLPDIYFGKYYFNGEGSKLYMTTGSSGSPAQQANIKADVVLVFDLTALPKLRLTQEIKTGPSGSLAFLVRNGVTETAPTELVHSCTSVAPGVLPPATLVLPCTSQVFSANAEAGSLVVIDGKTDSVLETIKVTEGAAHARIWILGERA